MKYIIIILLVLSGIASVAQTRPTGNPSVLSTNGWYKIAWVESDSGAIIRPRDTASFFPRFTGTIVMQPNIRKFYYYDSTDLRWYPLAGTFDTTSLSNRINLKLNISDTAAMLSPYLRKADTTNKWVQDVYVRSDSLFKFKNGIETFLDTLNGGGGSGSGTVTSVALSMPSAFSVSGSPITTSGTFAVTGAGTSLQYVRGNGTLATTDTGMIPNFYLKVRGLLTGTSPITFNQTTGAIGINNANTTGTKGAATFTSAFSDNGSGTIDLLSIVTAGSCTSCNVTFDAKGRATAFANGSGGSGADTTGLQDVITNDPDLSKNDTINQQGYRLYFTNGPLESDSVIFTPTESFMSTDSILGVGHSIANLLGASTADSNFIGRAHTYFNKPWANWAQVGAGIIRVVWQHNTNTGPGDHRTTIAMGALNTIRANWHNVKTYREIVNAYKAIFCNQFASVQDSASGANATRSGSGWSTYAGQADAAKFNTTSFTNVQNDSISYAFTGPGVGIVMMGTDSSAAQYIGSIVNIKIDGVSQGLFATNNQADGIADFISGFPGHRAPMAFIFYNLKDTIHNVTIVNTESHYMYVDYFCKFVNPTDAFPYVIMNEPYMAAGGYAGVGSNALIDAFNHGEDSMAVTLPHNFPVHIGKTNTVYNAGATTADIAGDDIHPNNLGHAEIFYYGLLTTLEHESPGKVFFTHNDLYLNDGTVNRKIYDTLNLVDATATRRGLVGLTAQTMGDGVKTFLDDIIVNTVNIGLGGGGFSSNTRVGAGAGNVWSGDLGNTAIGQSALNGCSNCFFMTAVGRTALATAVSSNESTALGHAAGNLSTGSANLFLGYSAGSTQTTGDNKLWIANSSTGATIYGDMSTKQLQFGTPSTPSLTASAALEIISTTRGFMTPVMTATQRLAISSPATSLEVFDTDSLRKMMYNGSAWKAVAWTTDVTIPTFNQVMTSGDDLSSTYTTTFTGTNRWIFNGTSASGVLEVNNTSSGPGVRGTSVGGYGVSGSGATAGVRGSSSSGPGGEFETNNNANLNAPVTSTNIGRTVDITNTIGGLDLIRSTVSGTPASGTGMNIRWWLPNNDGSNSSVRNTIDAVTTTATPASFASDLVFRTTTGGSIGDALVLKGSKQMILSAYGVGTFTGTPVSYLIATSSGSIVEQAATALPLISTGTAAPATTPGKVGDIFVDTNNKKLYFATGTASSADWTIAN